jgi:hypothetical protein
LGQAEAFARLAQPVGNFGPLALHILKCGISFNGHVPY